MADDQLRTLRRLMKRYRIQFRQSGDQAPQIHADTFNNIKKLGSYDFDHYSAGVSIWSSKEPWKQQMKTRAEWLCQRAQRLFDQERNEAGWRFGLENHILGRFSAEVACPRCRARIWQSEIQATLGNYQIEHAQELEQRRDRRKPCQCPPNERLKDFYEIGTNPLFDDRAQEFVVYDELLRSQLPKQGPDRVLGLQNTRNLDNLLTSPVRPDLAKHPDNTVSDILRTTPFKSETDPLLYPFLLLEAKSEASSSGFDAIQVQSAFPIHALLKLQEELRSHVDWSPGEERFEPLVWFLASRGDQWRVYASHVDNGADDEPPKYGITLLWSGSLLHKDNALQLLLIVDYIMDWARDIYRLAILKQLQSLVTGQAFDQVSIVDSEIFSMRRDVNSWIPAPPSTVFDDTVELNGAMDEDGPPQMSLNHQAVLGSQIPNTKLGSVRSASLVDSRFDCFYLTQRHIPSFLQVVGGRQDNKSNTEKAARHIINFIIQFDEVLVLSGADLEVLESLWTSTTRPNPEREEDFYVVMECSWYLTHSWQITRQLSCFAISKAAFETMKTYARFSMHHKDIENMHQRERRCPQRVLRQCVECLRAGSPWQVLLAAISSTLVTIYPLAARRREDFAPPVDVLGLGYAYDDRVRTFILKYLKRTLWKPRRRINVPHYEMQAALRQGYTPEQVFAAKRDNPPEHTDMTWKRLSEQRTHILDGECHDFDLCGRCRQRPETTVSPFAHGYLDTRNQPVLSDYGAVFIMALPDPAKPDMIPDACVYSLKPLRDIKNDMALSIMIEDMMQGSYVFHALKCGVNDIKSNEGMNYNLPLPYRTAAHDEEVCLLNWARELRDEPLLRDKDHTGYEAWLNEPYNPHIFMLYLSIGHREQEAMMLAKKATNRELQFSNVVWQIKNNTVGDIFFDFSPHQTVSLHGTELTPRFVTWDSGMKYLRANYPKQFQSLGTPQTPISV
ncbi:hypothetical protein BDW59DRAFT_152285 [Aspergillus cavernicola]|uniref:Heterokaryon incompatibility domain-containing protein n=1 Tax=Aspergillus cavernicola TaxID=176166 RepID=A0ABR4HRD6_9EURO